MKRHFCNVQILNECILILSDMCNNITQGGYNLKFR